MQNLISETCFLPALKRQCTAIANVEADDDVQFPASDCDVHKAALDFETPARPDNSSDEDLTFPDFLPRALYITAVRELGQGGTQTLIKCLNLWRAGRFEESMLREFVESIAWQSPSLSKNLPSSRKSNEDSCDESDCELLSPSDLLELMNGPRLVSLGSPSSPAHTPRYEKPCASRLVHSALEQEEIQQALDLVSSTSMLDSSKTSKLAKLVQLYPKLSPFFVSNGWDNTLNRFTSAPEWSQAQSRLRSALSLAPSRKRKASCWE